MENTESLAIFGWAFLVLIAGMIFIPYLRGKSDLLSSWNILLLGAGMFTGISCLEVTYGYFHWPETKWFHPSQELQYKYMALTVLFFGSLFFFYYAVPFTKWPAAGRLQKWPELTIGLLVFVLVVCTTVVGLALLTAGRYPFWGSLTLNLSHKAVVCATVFSFVCWYRNKINLWLLALFAVVITAAALYAMLTFNGRRLLMSVAFAPMLCMYWMRWRYRGRVTNVLFAGCLAGAVVLGGAFYSSFRHFDKQHHIVRQTRTVGNVINAMKNVTLKDVKDQLTGNALHYFSQYCAHYSLLTIHMIDNNRMERYPYNVLAFLGSYPIPRAYWPEKPEPPSRLIVRTLDMPYKTNWGLGIVGEAYYDGGAIPLVLYAFLLAVGIRFLDEPLRRQPTNPFLLTIFAAAFPHILSWTRGGVAIMTIETIECFIFAILLGYCARLFFGTAPVTSADTRSAYSYYQSGLRVPSAG